tara:strand:- start:4575 stop:5276 length:702 start_codon:yes stop_codon:yes gene_type:complete
MPVVTIEGYLGSGYQVIGRKVAEKLNIDFVDRVILSEIAKEMDTNLAEIINLEKKPEEKSLAKRLADRLLSALEKSALAGGGADPFFGQGVEHLLSQPFKVYPESEELTENLNFTIAIKKVIKEIANQGSVVILGRGASGVLRNDKNALKIGIYCEEEIRVKKYAERYSISYDESRKKIVEYDQGKKNYYLNVFKKQPLDPSIFNMIFNSELLSEEEIIEDICKNTEKYINNK